MAFEDRLGWMLLGCGIGFILGYLVRTIQAMKGELDEVDGLVKRKLGDRQNDHPAPDEGLVRFPIVLDIALAVVIALTVWAAFSSQKATNDANEANERTSVISVCNQKFLAKTLEALNDRTVYTQAQLVSNVKVQKAQAEFFKLLLEQPPESEAKRRAAAENYLASLNMFVEVSEKNAATIATNPFPEIGDLKRCLDPQKYPSTKETSND